MAEGGKQNASLALFGTQGAGKTSALAQICNLLGSFDEGEHATTKDLAQSLGRPESEHGWMLDRLLTERERGTTIQPSLQKFDTGLFRFTAVDAPGHDDYAKCMLSVASLADVAVLVVSAAVGEFESGMDSGRIREVALCCFTMGIKNIVVWVTKMDHPSVDYDPARYEAVMKGVNIFLKEVGYKQKDAPFVPVSGLTGENLVAKCAEMGWYKGPTAIDSLDSIGALNRPAEKPLRIPVLRVHDVEGTGTVVVGRVETGTLRIGIKVVFSPGGLMGEVKSIQVCGERVTEAKGGDVVGFSVGGGMRPGDIRRGMVASFSTNDPAQDAETFVAQIVILDHPGIIRPGYCPAIAVHTAQVPCEFEELISKLDRKTGQVLEANPERAKSNEMVTVRLRPRAQVCVETFSAYPSLGRFAVRDHGRTVAVGVIKEVTKLPIPKMRSRDENTYFGGS